MIRTKLSHDVSALAHMKLADDGYDPGFLYKATDKLTGAKDWLMNNIYESGQAEQDFNQAQEDAMRTVRQLPGEATDAVVRGAAKARDYVDQTGRDIGSFVNRGADTMRDKATQGMAYVADLPRRGAEYIGDRAVELDRAILGKYNDLSSGVNNAIADRLARIQQAAAGYDPERVRYMADKERKSIERDRYLRARDFAKELGSIGLDTARGLPQAIKDDAGAAGQYLMDESGKSLGSMRELLAPYLSAEVDNIADLEQKGRGLIGGISDSVARGVEREPVARQLAKDNISAGEAERDAAMDGIPADTLDNIRDMLARGVSGAGNAVSSGAANVKGKWDELDDNTKKSLGLAAGGVTGAAGLLKLLQLVAKARGKNIGPAPV